MLKPVIDPKLLGTARITPSGSFEAGSYASFALVYTAGHHGIDDSGSLRIVSRFASDQTRPQFEDPTVYNYTTVEPSNNAVLEIRYDPTERKTTSLNSSHSCATSMY